MKRISKVFADVCDKHNLYHAYCLARKGKGDRSEVSRFDLNQELELANLHDQLVNKTYVPGKYRFRTIYERKPRLISVAPFRDRVVHHALMSVLEPRIDPQFIYDSYACRKNKGVHAAIARYQRWAANYPYVLHLDIASYFASVDHSVLKAQLRKKIKDRDVLSVLTKIIDSSQRSPGKGLPIGNLTSQFFANLYLNDFDHWLKHDKGQQAYLRSVDDFFIMGRNKAELWCLIDDIQLKLSELGLALHPNKIHLRRTSERVDVLGYVLTDQRRWLRNTNGYRFQRRLKQMAKRHRMGELTFSEMRSRVKSWIGHAVHAETQALRVSIFEKVRL